MNMFKNLPISKRYTHWIIIATSLCVFMALPQVALAVDCPTGKSNTVLAESCIFANTVDGVDGGDLTINTGITLTVADGQTLVRNNGKQIILNGGSIVMIGTGQIQETNLWCTDADSDGYCATVGSYSAQDTSPAPGARLVRDMASISVADCSDANANLNLSCSWSESKYIQVISGASLSNYGVLVTIDTASLISGGLMQSSCNDLRFYDQNEVVSYQYWIESGCNTATTQVWVQVSAIPVGTSYILMKYNEPAAEPGSMAWNGTNTIVPRKTDCPGTASRYSALDGLFPRGSSTYGGTGTGAHTHTLSGTTSTQANDSAAQSGGNYTIDVTNGHSHTYTTTSSSSVYLPPYVDTVFCSYPSIPNQLDTNDLALFDTLPTGWTRNATYDTRFPRGAASYGSIGDGNHTHTYSVNTSLYSWVVVTFSYVPSNPHTWLSGYHRHLVNGTLASSAPNPLFRNQIFASPNSSATLPEGTIILMDSATLPPLGWTRFSAMDTRFPRGLSTSGSTGGSTTHNHSFSFTSGVPSVQQSGVDSASSNGYTGSGHRHTGSGTTNAPTVLPPYLNMIYAQKNMPSSVLTVNVLDQLP